MRNVNPAASPRTGMLEKRDAVTRAGIEVRKPVESQQDVTAAVLAAMRKTSDPRLRGIITSLVSHLHAFVRDVRLTEPEFKRESFRHHSYVSGVASGVIAGFGTQGYQLALRRMARLIETGGT